MDLNEYQARALLQRQGVPLPVAHLACDPAQARAAAVRLGGTVVVKAQVTAGGRGKAGGVRLAHSPDQAEAVAATILGLTIAGQAVNSVLVAAGVEIVREFYLSILLDRAERGWLALASAEGGVEIEELARHRPHAIARIQIDPLTGLSDQTTAAIVGLFPAAVRDQAAAIVQGLWQTLRTEDATLVEINPLVLTAEGQLLALDAKICLDDNADFRHPDRRDLIDPTSVDPLEAAAAALGLGYVGLDGQIGIIGNGAGLVMATLDVVAQAGQRYGDLAPANFLDIGGGASASVMAGGLEIVARNRSVRSILVNVFGGITACDEVARGILDALDLLGEQAAVPLVVRLDGNAAAQGQAILRAANHRLIHVAVTMDEAAELAARLASGSKAAVA